MPSRPLAAWPMFRLVPGSIAFAGEELGPDRFFTADRLINMHLKGVPQFRLCPSCGKRMTKVSTSEIYECKGCRVFVTDGADM